MANRHLRYKAIELRILSILEMHTESMNRETRPFVKSNIENYIRLWTTRLEWLKLQDKDDVKMSTVKSLKYKDAIRFIEKHKKKQDKFFKKILKIEPKQ